MAGGCGVAAWLAGAATLAALAAGERLSPYGSNYSVRYGKIPSDYNGDSDCVANRRLQMRPYPGDCYGHDWQVTDQDSWWNLFSEIGGDLQYTFDFILHDPIVQSAEVNQFWYLLAYLQRLARLVTDPGDVLTVKDGRRALAAGRRAGTQRAERLAAKLQADLSMLDALIVEAEAARRRPPLSRSARRASLTKRSHTTKT